MATCFTIGCQELGRCQDDPKKCRVLRINQPKAKNRFQSRASHAIARARVEDALRPIPGADYTEQVLNEAAKLPEWYARKYIQSRLKSRSA